MKTFNAAEKGQLKKHVEARKDDRDYLIRIVSRQEAAIRSIENDLKNLARMIPQIEFRTTKRISELEAVIQKKKGALAYNQAQLAYLVELVKPKKPKRRPSKKSAKGGN